MTCLLSRICWGVWSLSWRQEKSHWQLKQDADVIRKAHRHIVSWPKPETMLAWTGQAVSKETSQGRMTAEAVPSRRVLSKQCDQKRGWRPWRPCWRGPRLGHERSPCGISWEHWEGVGGAGSCQQHCGITPGGILPGSSVLGVSINTCWWADWKIVSESVFSW